MISKKEVREIFIDIFVDSIMELYNRQGRIYDWSITPEIIAFEVFNSHYLTVQVVGISML